MKNAFKQALATYAPSLLSRLRRFRMERYYRGQRARLERVLAGVTREHGLVVQSGPFAGMKYIDRTSWSALIPKLLGIYERELDDVIARLIARRYATVINVGCGEGYYAVGMARAMPGAKVIAYDIDAEGRRLCSKIGQLNGVEPRLFIRKECTHASLAGDLGPRSLVVSDCEGYELYLFDPLKCPALKQADILLELHEFAEAGLTREILQRFSSTHDIELITAVPAGPELARGLESLSLEDRMFAVSEDRPPGMQWAMMTARSKAAP